MLEYEATTVDKNSTVSKGEFLRGLKASGRKLNQKTLEACIEPKLPDDLQQFWYSFWNLNRERTNNGFSPQALNLAQIKDELELYDLYDKTGVMYLRALDDMYLKWVHEKYFTDKKDAKGKK